MIWAKIRVGFQNVLNLFLFLTQNTYLLNTSLTTGITSLQKTVNVLCYVIRWYTR